MPQKLADGTEVFTQAELEAQVTERNKGLEANHTKAMDQLKAAQRDLAAMKESWDGLDPKEVRALVTASQEGEKKKLKDKGDWDGREKQLTDAHAKDLAAVNGKLQKATGAVRKALVTAKLAEAIAGKKGDVGLLLPHAERFVDVKETDEGYEAFVTDGNGHAAVADGKGTPMTFDMLVEGELMKKYPRAFDGPGASGSGASKSAGGAGGAAKTIAADDNSAFLANLDGIAKGTVVAGA